MPLTTGSVFLAGALLSCLLPIGLLISFATYFYRQTRRLPANVTTASATHDEFETTPLAGDPTDPPNDSPAAH